MLGIGNNGFNNMIDTHCHLYDASFQEDFYEVIARAKANGVEKILLPNIDQTSWKPLKEVVNNSSIPCYTMLGLHPCYVRENYEQDLSFFRQELVTGHEELTAIGEIGLDLYWDKTYLSEQKTVLRRQLDWALEFKLPVALHVREAFEEIFGVLTDYKTSSLKGVFHCFSGSEAQANYIIKHHPSFFFGIGGVITYSKSGLCDLVQMLPRDRILLETDAPYLAPSPHRGKRNEPAFLTPVAQKLGSALNISFHEVCQLTTANAQQLFNFNV